MTDSADLLIIGAGPSGISCAIEAKHAGLTAIVLEKGSVVDYIRRFPANLVWFSTPELLEIGDVPFVISTVRPTRIDTLNYYHKVVDHYRLDIRTFDPVEKVQRGVSEFLVRTASGKTYTGRNVVVATGYFDNPNRLGVAGEDMPHVAHYYDEPFRYFGCNVAVVGGRNSAVEAALDLFRHGARVTLIHRGPSLSEGVKYWILPDIENRIKSEQIEVMFSSTVEEIRSGEVSVRSASGTTILKTEFVFVLIGFHPDTDLLERFGVDIDRETLAPCSDKHYETNVPGLFVAGSVVAGRFNNKIFVENGRLHGRQIIKAIAGKSPKS
jgi:thioredoxin reductase (NADPH)